MIYISLVSFFLGLSFVLIFYFSNKNKTKVINKMSTDASYKNEKIVDLKKEVENKRNELMIQFSLVLYDNEDWRRNIVFLLIGALVLTLLLVVKLLYNSSLLFVLSLYIFIITLSFLMLFIAYVMKKKNRFNSDFMKFIDLFSSHCSAGRSVTRCFELATVGLTKNILKQDIEKITHHLTNGFTIEQCINLTLTTERFPYLSYRLFFTMVSISMKKGGELSGNIKWLREQIIKKKKIEDKIKIMTAEAKMSRNILIALPVSFMLITYFFNKNNFLWLIDTHPGKVVLISCWSAILLGILVSSLIVSRASKP